MKKRSYDSLPAFVGKCIALQKMDFVWMPLVILVVFAVLQIVFLLLAAGTGDTELLHASIPGLIAFVAAAGLGVFQSSARFSMEIRTGVHMSVSRRRMIVGELSISILNSASMVALAALLQLIWHCAFGAAPDADDLMAKFPLWAWIMAVYLPAAAGVLCGAIVMRFGKRGFWVLYGLFLLCCFTPSLTDKGDMLGIVNWQAVYAALPLAGPIAAIILAAAGIAILWRVPVQN